MRLFDLFKMLLVCGIGGDSPPAQTSTTNVVQQYSPEEAARRAQLMQTAQQIYEANAGRVQGMAPGGPTADTLQAQNLMRNFANSAPYAGMMGQLQNAQTFGLQGVLDPTSSPGFQASLDTATRKVNEAYTGPSGPMAQIRSQFQANNSGGSGTREGIAMGMAGRDYLNTIGDVTGKLTSDAYTKGLDVFSRTMALAPQNIQTEISTGMLPANIIGSIGQQNEAYDERQRLWDINAPWQALAPYANIVSGMSNPSTQTTSTVPGPQANPLAPVGGAMMGASLAAMTGFNPIIGAGAGLMLSLFS